MFMGSAAEGVGSSVGSVANFGVGKAEATKYIGKKNDLCRELVLVPLLAEVLPRLIWLTSTRDLVCLATMELSPYPRACSEEFGMMCDKKPSI